MDVGQVIVSLNTYVKRHFLFLIFTAEIEAVEDIWLIGDQFFNGVFPQLQHLKTSAQIAGNRLPFIYEQFNITGYSNGNVSSKNAFSRMYNSFIQALNNKFKLPRYVVLIPDNDLVKSIKFFDYGIKETFAETLKWLIVQIERALDARIDDLLRKRTGAMRPNHTKIIWVKMLPRPLASGNNNIVEKTNKVVVLRKKFNTVLENLLASRKHSHIMNIQLNQNRFFDNYSSLTFNGAREYWLEIDAQLRSFHKHEIDLVPVYKPENNNRRYNEDPWNRDNGNDDYKSFSVKRF